MADEKVVILELNKITEKLEKVEERLDCIDGRLNNLDITSAKQEVNLETHMRRTELAEESIQIIRSEIQPLKKHIHMVEGAFKLLGVVSLIVGLMRAVGLI